MKFLTDLLTNRIFLSAAFGWLVAQTAKVMIAFFKKEFKAERLVGGGGMPSSHSATVTGLCVSTAYFYGAGGFEFVMALFFSFIVIYDALGVRLETGREAEILNRLRERDIAEGTALNLRFSHDSCLLPLFSLMGLNGFGIVTTDPEEANANWKGYDVPMAANLQLVFYRNRRGEILVKPMLNGHDATLPFPPADGPFYRWTDFQAFYLPVIAESKRFMAQYAE